MIDSIPFRPPRPEHCALAGPVGHLEAILEIPPVPVVSRVALVCHPHPLFGGTMQNKVVHMTARALQERGVPTLRFNFRGVGASEGTFDGGEGETADALAAVDWLRARFPGASVILAGFSFGSYVAYRVATERPTERLITIAPPIQRFDFDRYPPPTVPWLVIQGDRDELVDYSTVRDWVDMQAYPPTLATISGGEHFFHGRLPELKAQVQAFLPSE